MWLLFPVLALAHSAPTLFDSRGPLKLELKSDFGAITRYEVQTGFDEDLYPGQLTVGAETLAVDLHVRGYSRRVLCPALPPLKIELPKGPKPAPFAHLDRDLKLVTSCNPQPDEQMKTAVARELLHYRWLAAMGFPSFRVRPAEITYRQNDGTEYSRGPGFLIENIKDLKRRLKLDDSQPAPAYEDLRTRLAIVELFLRNHDYNLWDIPGEPDHNVRKVVNGEGKPLALVPYDFDLTQHTRQVVTVDLNQLRQELSTWVNRPESRAAALAELREIAAHKAALLAEVELSGLGRADRKRFRKWVEDFARLAAELSAKSD